jgi:hypothetical protein
MQNARVSGCDCDGSFLIWAPDHVEMLFARTARGQPRIILTASRGLKGLGDTRIHIPQRLKVAFTSQYSVAILESARRWPQGIL